MSSLSPTRLLVRFKAAALILLGPVAALASFFAAQSLAGTLRKNEVDLATLGQPTAWLMTEPIWVVVPGAAVLLFGLLALLSRRGGLLWVILGTLCLLFAVGLMMLVLIQVLGPMYEYKAM